MEFRSFLSGEYFAPFAPESPSQGRLPVPNILHSKSAHPSQVHFVVQAESTAAQSVPMIANSARIAAAPLWKWGVRRSLPLPPRRLPQPAKSVIQFPKWILCAVALLALVRRC